MAKKQELTKKALENKSKTETQNQKKPPKKIPQEEPQVEGFCQHCRHRETARGSRGWCFRRSEFVNRKHEICEEFRSKS